MQLNDVISHIDIKFIIFFLDAVVAPVPSIIILKWNVIWAWLHQINIFCLNDFFGESLWREYGVEGCDISHRFSLY